MRLCPMYAIVVLIAFATVLLSKSVVGFQPVVQERVVYAESSRTPPSTSCRFPVRPGISTEQTAWQIFVAATCPDAVGHAQAITWEDWTEQGRARLPGREAIRDDPGNAASTPASAKATSSPDPPWDCETRQSGRTICEEVRVNPAMKAWLSAANSTPPAVVFTAYAGGEMLPPLVEIKADWIKLASCAHPPQGAHVERIGSTCYELGGIHLVSEFFNRWISATFEVQDMTSNPMRCRVLGCRDAWGSVPTVSKGGAGGNTRVSADLSSLMQEANLGSEWLNYRLDEAQISGIDSLGNVMTPEADQASSGGGGEADSTSRRWGSTITPTPLEEDTPARRASLFLMSSRCPGEELGRDCPTGVAPRKGKTKRKT